MGFKVFDGLLRRYCPSLPLGGDGTTTLHNLDIDGNRVGLINGTLVGMDATNWVTSDSKKALSFNGSDEYVNISDTTAGIARARSTITIAGHVFIDSLTNNQYLYYESTRLFDTAKLNLFVNSAGGISLGGRLTDVSSFIFFATTNTGLVSTGQWHHITGVYDGVTGIHKIYLDGIDVTLSRTGIGSFEDADSLIIRIASHFSFQFDGLLDDLIIFDRVKSTADIATLAANRGYFPGSSIFNPFRTTVYNPFAS
jgi:hypothetical protein